MFRLQKTSEKTRIELYSILALPSLLYFSENWPIQARDTRRVMESEMKYMRKTAGCTRTDYTTNTEMSK